MKSIFYSILVILVISCNKSYKEVIIADTFESIEIIENNIITEENPIQQMINISWDNLDWITEFDWSLTDGRYLDDPTAVLFDWIGDMTPIVRIYKFDIPEDCDLYHVRLRNELFYFQYQTEEKNKLFPIGTSFGVVEFELIFNDDFTSRTLNRGGYFFTRDTRVGIQDNPDYPLVGIWGRLPSLSEYRLLKPVDCLYYMEIDKKIPGFAIREGTYLLKKTGERTLETISSFEDGHLLLEFINNYSIKIIPLFVLSDEEGIIAPLKMDCNPYNPRFIKED